MEEHDKNFYSLEELKRERDCYEGYKDGEEVFYFVGALRYACDEIERLNNIINKAIEYVEANYLFQLDYEDDVIREVYDDEAKEYLLNILKGVYKKDDKK